MNVNAAITALLNYAEKKKLSDKRDRHYLANLIAAELGLSEFCEEEIEKAPELHEILDALCECAYENGKLEANSVVYKDLFDTKIMGILTPRPSEVIDKFEALYKEDPEAATDYFYAVSCDSNYIRRDRIAKDLKWAHPSKYGNIEITVNLSKPEKDPKAIAAARNLPQSGYPKCLLCHENEGYAGNVSKPARQNLRQIPFDMSGTDWYLQYSPYVYYNEHCIALSREHYPMKVNSDTVKKILSFVETFPHYFIGSNAGLPVVGGSILAHDHMQGGRYTFAMELAKEEKALVFDGFSDVEAFKLCWPMAVIRMRSKSKERLIELSKKIFEKWDTFTDEEAGIFAFTNGEPHNAITPIARRRGDAYEVDLALRNNITTEEFPLGVFHPHPEHHNIKKENIGLIEVMGLAILPARLKSEIELMKEAILSGTDFATVPDIEKHKAWFERFATDYAFTEANVEDILRTEIGKTFVRVLEDASVFKNTESGNAQFMRFVDHVNEV